MRIFGTRIALDRDRTIGVLGVVAAGAIAVFANILGTRHFKRWDVTEGHRYSLSPPTIETLHEIPDPIDIWVLLGGGDPMEQSIKQLLVAYQAETRNLVVHYVDPDRDAAQLAQVRRDFKIEAGRSSDGKDPNAAIVIVAHGPKHWFLSESDLIEVNEKDPKVNPREEQAITGAIRNVLGGEKATLCFTTGHGERALVDGTDEGLGYLKDILERDNYETRTVDTTDPNAHEPFTGCTVVLVVPPSVRTGTLGAFSEAEIERLRTYLLSGGNFLLALGPEADAAAPGMARVLEPFGIGLEQKWVLEADPRLVFPDTRLNTFIVTAKRHPVTASLAVDPDSARPPPKIVLEMVRPLRHTGTAEAADLLVTSEHSFAVGFARAAAIARGDAPVKEPGDASGPFVVAMASERPKTSPSDPHGPRVVVLGTAAAFSPVLWRQEAPFRGTAVLVENAIAYLAAKPRVLDIPARPSVAAGMRISDEARSEVRRYVMIYMPLAVAILGLAIGLVRRQSEGKAGTNRKAEKRARNEKEEDDAS